jgi:hypothetical protein
MAEEVSAADGGDIVFKFDEYSNRVINIAVFNTTSGGNIVFELEDGTSVEAPISELAQGEDETISVDVSSVVQMTVHFDGHGALVSVGVCVDPRKTPAPVGFAPPVETREPTAAPTMSPEPTPGPTPTTTPAPTFEVLPTGECPEDVELIGQVGESDFPEIPIIILEQHTDWVKFAVRNPYTETISRIFTQFHEAPTGQTECFEDDYVERGEYVEYIAYCMTSVPISVVDIWVTDEFLDDYLDTAEIPECCHPPKNEKHPTVQYTFKLKCESECPPDESRKLLDNEAATELASDALPRFKRESGISASEPNRDSKDSHHCVAEDYPCGEDGGMVKICHYSTKDGYQTFCVPEPDSDILAFFPDDYCGPCVGGYSSHRTD